MVATLAGALPASSVGLRKTSTKSICCAPPGIGEGASKLTSARASRKAVVKLSTSISGSAFPLLNVGTAIGPGVTILRLILNLRKQ